MTFAKKEEGPVAPDPQKLVVCEQHSNYYYGSSIPAYWEADPLRGEFIGDGVPRTAGGLPYEPLSWPHNKEASR